MIRNMKEKDLEKVLEIYNDAIVNTTAVYHYEAQTIEERKKWYKDKLNSHLPMIVYEENEEVIGFATYGPFRPWPAYHYTIEHSVYVDKKKRSKGVGTLLLKELIRIANENEYAIMVAGIDASNEKSIKVHELLGFEYSGTIKKVGFKFGKWLDLAFYQLELNGPTSPVEKI